MNSPTDLPTAPNALIKIARALTTHHGRKKHGKTIIEGDSLIDTAKHYPHLIKNAVMLVSAAKGDTTHKAINGCPTFVLDDKIYRQISAFDGQKMLIIPIPMPSDFDPSGDCVIIDGIQDSGNLGTILRTSAGAGVRQVLCLNGTASAWSPKALRAGMGAQFGLNIFENQAFIPDMTQARLLATSSHAKGSVYHTDLTAPCAWVFGHEGAGVSDEILAHACAVSLPQKSQESLNVAIAAAICLYEMVRQRDFS